MQLDLSRSTKSCRMWRPFLFFCFVRGSGKGADEERTTSCRLFINHTIYANPLKTLKRKYTMFSLFKKWFQQQNEFSTEFKSTEINKIKNVCPSFTYQWIENGNFDKKTSCCYCEWILTVIKSSWKQKKL